MRVLALDYGRARCGCAVSDPTGVLASPVEPVLRPDDTARARAPARAGPRARGRAGGRGVAVCRCRAGTRRRRPRRGRSRPAWSRSCRSRWSFTTSASRRVWPSGPGGGRTRTRAPRRTCSRAGWPASRGGLRCLTGSSGRPRTGTRRGSARAGADYGAAGRGAARSPPAQRRSRRAGRRPSAGEPAARRGCAKVGRPAPRRARAGARRRRDLVPDRAVPAVPRLAARQRHGHDPAAFDRQARSATSLPQPAWSPRASSSTCARRSPASAATCAPARTTSSRT